jgi:hypothetical protein
MTIFTVTGNGWEQEVEIDESLYEKYGDMGMEAMTRAAENILNGEDEVAWGFVLLAHEKGYSKDPAKIIACLTEVVFRNAGYHELADQAKRQARKMIEGGTN